MNIEITLLYKLTDLIAQTKWIGYFKLIDIPVIWGPIAVFRAASVDDCKEVLPCVILLDGFVII